MVGLADIPVVGVFVERVSEYTVEALFRGLRYMFCYKALVDQLSSETEKLKNEEANMSREVEKEQKNGKVIKDYVSKWQANAQEIQKSGAEELSPSCSCIQGLPVPNPISRFRIGRNAVKKAEAVTRVTNSGKEHLAGEIAYLPEVVYMPNSDTTFEEFESRKYAYQSLWDSLVNEDGPLIHGIYGMAGVGKTRMMEQFWEEAIKKKIFKKAVRVNVGSENMDKTKLQGQIAGLLECDLESEVMERRASQLENSLRNGDKLVVIFDDVWRDIQLDRIIGTPFDNSRSSSKGSKILFTSRKKEVCLNNKCKNLIEVRTLSPDEALCLFKKTVGTSDSNNPLPDESLVKDVCDKCGELPLLIRAVGKALKGKPHYWWRDAQDQLKKGKFEEITDVDPQVYSGIKLSIDYLQNDDAKSCLFLCSMFPEDADIDIKMLIQLATGSRLIPSGESRVLAMLDYLKRSSLLLGSGEDDEIKVHDIIRAVARSIAFTDSKYAFLQVICTSQNLPYNANYSTQKFLRLDAETGNVHFDENLVCRDLHTLWLQSNDHPQQFSAGFYSMFVNLSCLMLQNVDISSEHFSLEPLSNLGTLSLLNCDISKTDARLLPKSLESLYICECELPRPLDVAHMKRLRKLEIQEMRPVWVMENAISDLCSLEELHIPNGFIHDYPQCRLEPVVKEISQLIRLKSLHFEFFMTSLHFPRDDDGTFAGTEVFSNIDRYSIFVGRAANEASGTRPRGKIPLTRSIEFTGKQSKPWEGLMARAEEVSLDYSNVEVRTICNEHRNAFQDLKILKIYDCGLTGHLASISRDEIQYSAQSATCFSKLTILNIGSCSELKYLFCADIAKGLGQLQELSVEFCESMEAIIMNEGGTSDGEIIKFSKLKSLRIEYLPRLKSFYAENPAYPYLLDELVSFPCLKYIYVCGCECLRSMFPPSVASNLTQLKQMTVEDCKEMRWIAGVDEQAISNGILFPNLTSLKLCGLPSLTCFLCYQSGKANTCRVPVRLPRLVSAVLKQLPDLKSFFYDENFELHMQALKKMEVHECGLSNLFTFSSFRKFQLKKLVVRNCEVLGNIVEGLRSDEICDQIITLSELKKVDLANLPNLKGFFHNANYEFEMPALKEVYVDGCRFSSLFTLSRFRNLQLENLQVENCDMLENLVEDLGGDEIRDKIITLTQITRMVLINLPNLKRFFHDTNYEFYMPVLKELTIHECGASKTLFTRSIFRNLQQLEELTVSSCKLLEGIFEDAKGDETLDMNDNIITLNQVSKVSLKGLPKLKTIFHGATYEWCMPALRDVTIAGCEPCVLFTCLVFQGIGQLRTLNVSECESLEHIVKEVGGDESSGSGINGKSITHSQLSSITLTSLPNLKSFSCTKSYVFNMPELNDFTLRECPKIEYFSSSDTNGPSVHVNRSTAWHSFTEDAFTNVNDYVRQITKGGAT